MFAAEIRRKRVEAMRQHTHWKWHLDEVYVKISGEMHYLWRAVDHEGEVLESYVTKTRDKAAALRHCQTKCTLTVKGGLHIGFEPALADANARFS
jgi:transposase-like protein